MSNSAAEVQAGRPDTTAQASASILLRGIDKRFGATHALAGIDLEVEGGTVHALIGENGAGKSTALGCIAGRVAFDEGTIEVGGTPIEPGDLRAARRAGVAAIYQELTIVPGLNAEANVFLADPLSRGGFLSKREMRTRYEALCEEIGVARVSAGALAGALSVAEQQLLEIMRSLVVQPRVILFDEPSAPLAIPEREALYGVIDTLKQRGITIVFVSHNLAEVQQLADRITVFRDGRKVVTAARGELNQAALVRHMLGDESRTLIALTEAMDAADAPAVAKPRRRPASDGPPLLAARNVTVPETIEGIDVEVRAGEILGIAGLVGSGRTTILRSIAGAEPGSSGELWIEGERVKWPRNVRAARRLGIALLPEDRKRQGLVMTMSAADNVALANLGAGLRNGLLARSKLTSAAAEATARLNFPVARLGERADRFSGGNQQKLLMGRWLHERPRVLLADEPTRGIDVGAKSELLEALRAIAAEGVGIVVVSSELEEVIAAADRVLVLAAGRAAGFFDGQSEEISMSTVLHAAFETGEGR
jgi:ABC-type sugar transport system ATPase subunit